MADFICTGVATLDRVWRVRPLGVRGPGAVPEGDEHILRTGGGGLEASSPKLLHHRQGEVQGRLLLLEAPGAPGTAILSPVTWIHDDFQAGGPGGAEAGVGRRAPSQ